MRWMIGLAPSGTSFLGLGWVLSLKLGLGALLLLLCMGCGLPWGWGVKRASGLEKKTPESGIVVAVPTRLTGSTMGTTYTVKYFGGWDETPQSVHREIDKRLLAFNQVFSTYEQASEITKLNQSLSEHEPGVTISLELSEVFLAELSVALELSLFTAGHFDVTIAPLVGLWGFGAKPLKTSRFSNSTEAERGLTVPTAVEITAMSERVGYQKLTLDRAARTVSMLGGMAFDFSAIAKGRGVDILGEYLEELGIRDYLIEIGGELRSSGAKPRAWADASLGGEAVSAPGQEEDILWTLSIVSPDENVRVANSSNSLESPTQGVKLKLSREVRGIATSGNYHNYVLREGVRYPHIIDPSTGVPVRHGLASVTVITGTCERADALATAFMVMGGERALGFAEAHQLAAFFIEEVAGKWVTYYSGAFAPYLVQE